MANTFSTDIDVLGLHRVVVRGTVDDPSHVANVEIFRDDTDVGSAHVSADGNWRLTVRPSTSSTPEFFSATVTDGADNQAVLKSGLSLSANFPLSVGNVAQLILSNLPQVNVFAPGDNLIVDATQQ